MTAIARATIMQALCHQMKCIIQVQRHYLSQNHNPHLVVTLPFISVNLQVITLSCHSIFTMRLMLMIKPLLLRLWQRYTKLLSWTDLLTFLVRSKRWATNCWTAETMASHWICLLHSFYRFWWLELWLIALCIKQHWFTHNVVTDAQIHFALCDIASLNYPKREYSVTINGNNCE